MSPPTDNDLEAHPHVFFTSDDTWDPNSLDDEYLPADVVLTEDEQTPTFG